MPKKVRDYLSDQRGPRKQVKALSRMISLRTSKEDDNAKDAEDEVDRTQEKKGITEEKEVTLEGKEDISESSFSSEGSNSETESISSEDGCTPKKKRKKTVTLPLKKPKSQRNTVKLTNFVRECDCYFLTNRSAGKVGNALLRDYGLVKPGDTRMLLDHHKIWRERKRCGKQVQKAHEETSLPQGLYFDGKKAPTLVREETVTNVRVPGGKGRATYREVKSKGNKKVIQDHYPLVSEPGSEYVTHVTPIESTGRALAREVVDVIRERSATIRVIGTDGCSVNTGIHNGAVRLIKVELNCVVQREVCGLHTNELGFWHIMAETDGVTKAKDKLSGPVGSLLNFNVWEQPVIAFRAMPSKVPELPPEVVKDLSRDQALGLKYCIGISAGKLPDSLVTQTIGPLVTCRWNTTANRILCLYTRTARPSKKLQRLTRMVLMFYYPGWFKFKTAPSI